MTNPSKDDVWRILCKLAQLREDYEIATPTMRERILSEYDKLWALIKDVTF